MRKIYSISLLLIVLLAFACKKDSVENCSKPVASAWASGSNSVQVSSNLNYDFIEIEYGPNTFTLGSGTKTNSALISGLNSGAYDFYIRGNCGGSEWSEWSDVKSLYLDAGQGGGGSSSCGVPEDFSNSASFYDKGVMSVSWDHPDYSEVGYYEFEYGPSGFAIGNGEKVSVNDSYYNDGAFAANTTYDVYVKANCGGSDWSNYSDVYSFYADKNYNSCLKPINIVAERNGSQVNFSFEPNGESEYEYVLVYAGDPPSSETYNTRDVNIHAASGGWTGVSSSARDFYIRAVCRDGGRSDWAKVYIP